ncbi:hypothetical protein [Mumia sp. Pv 4-285]|uniref:hypothetical protein n=1 Tax=Mumia qirimensis TaxID=3234852 RepID=UPI00351D9712
MYGDPHPPTYAQQPQPGQPLQQPPYPQEKVTFRPDAARARSQTLRRSAAVVGLVAVLLLTSDSLAEVGFKLVAFVVAAIVGVLLLVRRLRSCRVELVPGWLRWTRPDGRHVVVDLSVSRGTLGKQALTGADLLTVVGPDGARLFRITSEEWRPEHLQAIARLCGFPIRPDLRKGKDWEAWLPGSTTLVDRHPVGIAVGVALGVVALIAVAIVAVSVVFV